MDPSILKVLKVTDVWVWIVGLDEKPRGFLYRGGLVSVNSAN